MVRSGLFTDGVAPALLGSHCPTCGAHHFPQQDTCPYCAAGQPMELEVVPYCAAEGPQPVELSGTGTLWAWTAVTAAPPGYQGEVPYGLGIVELPEGIRIISRLSTSDPAALAPGQPMELEVVPLHVDAEGNDVVTYSFAPVAP
jgi:uncharacterized OB-fold protein